MSRVNNGVKLLSMAGSLQMHCVFQSGKRRDGVEPRENKVHWAQRKLTERGTRKKKQMKNVKNTPFSWET